MHAGQLFLYLTHSADNDTLLKVFIHMGGRKSVSSVYKCIKQSRHAYENRIDKTMHIQPESNMDKREPSILIQGAMDTETDWLIGRLQEEKPLQVGNWLFHCGYLGKKKVPVIINRTYQGMVNAGAATAAALSYLPVKAVVNQGIAGGYDPQLHTGDVVIGREIIPMGAVQRPYRPAGAGISEEGVSRLPLEIYRRDRRRTEKVTSFSSNEYLVKQAQQLPFGGRKITGVIGSADEWNNELDRIASLREQYGISCEDMESGAAAQICASYAVPFIGIRILSNTILHKEPLDETQGSVLEEWIEQYVQTLTQETCAAITSRKDLT